LHIVGILFPHINDNARSKSHKIYIFRILRVSFVNVSQEGVRDKWEPVTTAWRVLRLRLEERPQIWRAAANILNKQSRTTDKGWSCLGVGRVANNSSP